MSKTKIIKAAMAALLVAYPALAWADPATIVVLVGQAMVAFGSGTYVYVGYALVAAGVVYGATSARRAAKKAATAARDAYNSNLGDRSATIISGIPPWRIVYGRATIGGSIHAMFTADKVSIVNGETITRKDALHYLVYVFAAHKCAQLHDVKIDGASAGPLDANGWSLNSEYRLTESRVAWGEQTLAPGQSLTADKPVLNVWAIDPTQNTNYSQGEYPTDYSASITVTGSGRTLTNADPSVTLTVSYTFFREAQSTFRFIWHDGGDNQTVDTLLNSLFPDKWTADHRIRGRAYAVVMVDLEDPKFQGGPPQITVDVTGRMVYDPRNASTTGSSNNALCVRDFLLSKWGASASPAEIDESYVTAAANACDASILVTVPSYQDNILSDFTANTNGWTGVNTDVIWASGAGGYIYAKTLAPEGFVYKTGYFFSGATNRYVRFRIRRMEGEGWRGRLYYSTAGHSWSDNFYKELPAGLPVGVTVEIVFDMHSLTFGGGDWKDSTITGLRFDFGEETHDRFDIFWIKLSEFAEATESQPKYTLNGSFTTNESREAVLESMAFSMGGFVTNTGSWLISAGSWAAPVRDFGDDDLDGQISLLQADSGVDALSNSAKGTYYQTGSSSPTDFEAYQNATLIADDGEELWEDLALPFTDNESRARNLARIVVERTRSGQILSIPLKLHAWNMQVGDRFRLTSSEYEFELKTYRVTDWGFSLTGAVQLTAQEDIAEIYDEVDTMLSDPTPNTNLQNPNIVQAVKGAAAYSGTGELTLRSDGTVHARVRVTWDAPQDPYLVAGSAYMELAWRRVARDPVGAWRTVRIPATSTSMYIEDVSEFDSLALGLRFVNSLGRTGPISYLTHVVVGKDDPPSPVTGLGAVTVEGVATISWETPADLDYAATEIRVGAGGWAGAAMLFRGKANSTTYRVSAPGTYLIYAKHLDTSGNYSADPAASYALDVTVADLASIPSSAIPADWNPGTSGGNGDFTLRPNAIDANTSGWPNLGEIYATGTRFSHPDGTARTTGLTGTLLSNYGEGQAGRFYVAYSETAKATRFPSLGSQGSATNLFLCRRKSSGGWEAFDDTGTAVTFTPVATDCIIAVVEAATSTYGISSISLLAGADYAISSGKNRVFLGTTAPSADAVGDLWLDSDEGNRIYRASAPGSGSWVALPYNTTALSPDSITEVVLVEDAGPVDTYGASSGSPVTVISVSAGPYIVDSEVIITIAATVAWALDPDTVGPFLPDEPHLFEIGNATDGWSSFKFGYIYNIDSTSLFATVKFQLPASTTRTYTTRATLSTGEYPGAGVGYTDWTNLSATAVVLKR